MSCEVVAALPRTRFVLEKLKEHVDANKITDPLLKNYLVGYILVIFYAEVEGKIPDILRGRLEVASNTSIAAFITMAISNVTKRTKKSEIIDIVQMFGVECKEKFNQKITEQEVQIYSNYLKQRHNVAHLNQGVETTWEEVQNIAEIGEKILSCFYTAINTVPNQVIGNGQETLQIQSGKI